MKDVPEHWPATRQSHIWGLKSGAAGGDGWGDGVVVYVTVYVYDVYVYIYMYIHTLFMYVLMSGFLGILTLIGQIFSKIWFLVPLYMCKLNTL